MPTKKESMEFVRKFKGALREQGLKSPSTMSSSELNNAIDKAVEKLEKVMEFMKTLTSALRLLARKVT